MSDFRKIEEELAEAFDAGGFEVMRKGGDVFICALPLTALAKRIAGA